MKQYRSLSSSSVAQNWAWDTIKRAVGVSEQSIARHNLYKAAEDSARAVLESEINDGVGKPSDTIMSGTEEMTNQMTGGRSWKIENADFEEQKEEVAKVAKKWEGENK